MRGVLERVLPAKLSLRAAEGIARAECERRGWPWTEPVRARRQLRGYRFWTNARSRGGNAEIVVDTNTGEVKRAWMGPR